MSDKLPFSTMVKEYQEEIYGLDTKGSLLLSRKTIYKYDENNRLREIHDYSSKDKLQDINYYTYDNLNNLLEIQIKTAKGNKKQRIVYEYSQNKLCQIVNTHRSYKAITKYDEHSNIVEEIFYRASDKPPYITKYINEYDSEGHLIKKQKITPDGRLDDVTQYKYNSNGLLIEENVTNGKTSFVLGGKEFKQSKNRITQHVYDNNGNLILSEYFSDGMITETHKKEITYNDLNDIIKITEYVKGIYFTNKNEFKPRRITKYSYIR